MRTKNRNTIYGFIGVILLISTTLPFYTLYNSNNIAVKNVTEDETEFNIMEYLLQNDFSENISEHAELIDAINVVISNQGENNNENDDNPKLKTSGLLSGTIVELPWWLELLFKNPLLGIAVLMVMGLGIGITEVAKALFAKAFPGVTEMFEALNEFIECMENLEENLGNALDNAFENVVEGCIEAIAEAIVDGLCYEPPNLWEVRELVSQQLKLIDSSTDWQNTKLCFVDAYITDSMSFKFKNLAGNLMYLCAMEFWIENKIYNFPDYEDPKTWYKPYNLNSWSDFADFALFYNLELSPCVIIADDYNIGFDFSNDGCVNYKSNNYIQSYGFLHFLGTKRSQEIVWGGAYIHEEEELIWQEMVNELSNALFNGFANDPDLESVRDEFKGVIESTERSTWDTIVEVMNNGPPLDFSQHPFFSLIVVLNWANQQEHRREELERIDKALHEFFDDIDNDEINKKIDEALDDFFDDIDDYGEYYDGSGDSNGQSTGDPDDGSSDDNGQSTGDPDDGSSDDNGQSTGDPDDG